MFEIRTFTSINIVLTRNISETSLLAKNVDWSFLSFAANAKFSFIRLEMSQTECKKSFLGNSNSQPWPLSPSVVMIEGKSHSQTFFNCHIHCIVLIPGRRKSVSLYFWRFELHCIFFRLKWGFEFEILAKLCFEPGWRTWYSQKWLKQMFFSCTYFYTH